MIHRLGSMIGSPDVSAGLPDGRYVRAVPSPFYGGLFDRARDAWAVLRGNVFAVHWPADGELEAALNGEPAPPPKKLKKLKW